ncbi:hypothetical protein MSAS_23920 [Mycobacterium saskatchewanense]|uniref:Uncharacterized protein n=1 Tax=Mycobacterium saskatchewanense TaxID=220927 RepID=A0AAJ3NN84_9MYCO|nr:hypothetical protein [Mycobacterium saskatchewanense]ORW70368.1 hypothetical protein AWC23_17090 [Mycobacterium saskatchewanense]BBX63218.1 hypothetical protein MSAS_23920 [Mycobacterium saskatchewanense]
MATDEQIVSGSLDPDQVMAEVRSITQDQALAAAHQITRLPSEQRQLYIRQLLIALRDDRGQQFVEDLIRDVLRDSECTHSDHPEVDAPEV